MELGTKRRVEVGPAGRDPRRAQRPAVWSQGSHLPSTVLLTFIIQTDVGGMSISQCARKPGM